MSGEAFEGLLSADEEKVALWFGRRVRDEVPEVTDGEAGGKDGFDL